jgi:NAD(P)-dependent dehydrogenase (short-subunit alcohol dehydrogenase family)
VRDQIDHRPDKLDRSCRRGGAEPTTAEKLMSTDQDPARVAVITGASSGIGEATARALAADGHRVALLARRADRVEALAGELPGDAIAIEADVTDRDSIVAAAERARHQLSPFMRNGAPSNRRSCRGLGFRLDHGHHASAQRHHQGGAECRPPDEHEDRAGDARAVEEQRGA